MLEGRTDVPDSMKQEWRKCPRCKTKDLKPELLCTDSDGTNRLWWICENIEKCSFPMDMPPDIYHVRQSPYQKAQKSVPLPKILKLPQQYQYMYPITFAMSRPASRCPSIACSNPNSRNETNDSSDCTSTFSEKSSGQDHLKADNVGVQSGVISNTYTPSSVPTSDVVVESEDNIDEDVEAASRSKSSVRVVRRKRSHESTKSWTYLIERVAMDPQASSAIINMKETELFSRMKEFFDAQYFRRTPPAYKRPSTGLDSLRKSNKCNDFRRVSYQVEDVETCLQVITKDEWTAARKKLPLLNIEEQTVMKTGNAQDILKSVGIDLQERRQAVREKVRKVMKGFSEENAPKRNKIGKEVEVVQKSKVDDVKSAIHQSVSARILNKKLQREGEERSRTCTPAPSVCSELSGDLAFGGPNVPSNPVQFHIGNNDEDFSEQSEEQHWGFDLDGLYDSIHAQNTTHIPDNNEDPADSLFSALEDLSNHADDQQGPSGEPQLDSVVEGVPADEHDDFTGFDNTDFNNHSNFDFVNENFDF